MFWAFVFVFVFLVYFVALGDTSRTSGGKGETDFCLGQETNQRTTKGREMVGTRWEVPAESWAGAGGPKGPSKFHCCPSGLTVFLLPFTFQIRWNVLWYYGQGVEPRKVRSDLGQVTVSLGSSVSLSIKWIVSSEASH